MLYHYLGNEIFIQSSFCTVNPQIISPMTIFSFRYPLSRCVEKDERYLIFFYKINGILQANVCVGYLSCVEAMCKRRAYHPVFEAKRRSFALVNLADFFKLSMIFRFRFNCGDIRCYRDLARLRGLRYMTWENSSKVFEHDKNLHESYGNHAKFWNFTFDPDEFVRLLTKARNWLIENPRFSHLRRHSEL